MLIIEEQTELEDVYDITVENNHNFFANGILVHNCTEILLHNKSSKYKNGIKTEIGETAVCNLHSINLSRHVVDGKINYDRLSKSVTTAVRSLDNVIDLNFYPTEEAKNSNLKHRPVGLGTMGFHDVCHLLNIQYDSEEGVKLADELQEFISFWAITASNILAKERGSYSTFNGSEWSKSILPIDTYLRKFKSEKNKSELDWDSLRTAVKSTGMRNSNVMAIAPTASISYIQGCEQSIEPNFSCLFVYENKSGNFYIINEHFVRDMKNEGLWTEKLAEELKRNDGDVSALNIPAKYKEKYKTAFDRDMDYLIKCAAARQKWIDMGQSFNIYMPSSLSMKAMNDIAFRCWHLGLKSTYYWRNKPASKIEKSTVEKVSEQPKVCSILDPGCLSCQ